MRDKFIMGVEDFKTLLSVTYRKRRKLEDI